jgi:ABC-type Mn2+/Zn2+ transport system ATPase subunit
MSASDADGISVRDLSVRFGPRIALERVSFTLPAGSFGGLLGPNGAGKTTLLRALLGQLPHTGTIEAPGTAGYVPQLGRMQTSFPVDALGVVLMGRYPHIGWWRRPDREDRERALDLLRQVGLADSAKAPFGSLSGGQRQRVLVARALAQEGEVLLLDEPLTGIDAASRDAVLDVIARERETGRTILMTTHDLHEAGAVCDRLLLLNRELIAEGSTEAVFTPEALRRAYGSEVLVLREGLVVLDDAAHHNHDHDAEA